MQHKTIDETRKIAEVVTVSPMLTDALERLERWASLLERTPEEKLSTLYQTEMASAQLRGVMRAQKSPIAVAFADPVLVQSGLRNDTFGEAKRFFDLSDHELHNVLCYCHFGQYVSAGTAAREVRQIVRNRRARSRVSKAVASVRSWLGWR